MGVEIERKFLVADDTWRAAADDGQSIRQGYLVADRERAVRVRLRDGQARLTIKGKLQGARRLEFEYDIPEEDGLELMDLALRPLVEKVRHLVHVDGVMFEIDVFSGENAGLVVAEVELPSEDAPFPRPPWLGEEVTDDPRYLNSNLVEHPFSAW